MKSLFILVALLGSSYAMADQACSALSSTVGSYKLVSKTCEGPFGNDLTVAPYDNGSFAGYVITTGGIGIGPSTSANATDKCTVSGNTITVQTCAFDLSCLPQYWTYNFSGANLIFSANGCEAQFQKVN